MAQNDVEDLLGLGTLLQETSTNTPTTASATSESPLNTPSQPKVSPNEECRPNFDKRRSSDFDNALKRELNYSNVSKSSGKSNSAPRRYSLDASAGNEFLRPGSSSSHRPTNQRTTKTSTQVVDLGSSVDHNSSKITLRIHDSGDKQPVKKTAQTSLGVSDDKMAHHRLMRKHRNKSKDRSYQAPLHARSSDNEQKKFDVSKSNSSGALGTGASGASASPGQSRTHKFDAAPAWAKQNTQQTGPKRNRRYVPLTRKQTQNKEKNISNNAPGRAEREDPIRNCTSEEKVMSAPREDPKQRPEERALGTHHHRNEIIRRSLEEKRRSSQGDIKMRKSTGDRSMNLVLDESDKIEEEKKSDDKNEVKKSVFRNSLNNLEDRLLSSGKLKVSEENPLKRTSSFDSMHPAPKEERERARSDFTKKELHRRSSDIINIHAPNMTTGVRRKSDTFENSDRGKEFATSLNIAIAKNSETKKDNKSLNIVTGRELKRRQSDFVGPLKKSSTNETLGRGRALRRHSSAVALLSDPVEKDCCPPTDLARKRSASCDKLEALQLGQDPTSIKSPRDRRRSLSLTSKELNKISMNSSFGSLCDTDDRSNKSDALDADLKSLVGLSVSGVVGEDKPSVIRIENPKPAMKGIESDPTSSGTNSSIKHQSRRSSSADSLDRLEDLLGTNEKRCDKVKCNNESQGGTTQSSSSEKDKDRGDPGERHTRRSSTTSSLDRSRQERRSSSSIILETAHAELENKKNHTRKKCIFSVLALILCYFVSLILVCALGFWLHMFMFCSNSMSCTEGQTFAELPANEGQQYLENSSQESHPTGKPTSRTEIAALTDPPTSMAQANKIVDPSSSSLAKNVPSSYPSDVPTNFPTLTAVPSAFPSLSPSTSTPTDNPSQYPSISPSTSFPSLSPSSSPSTSIAPSSSPTGLPDCPELLLKSLLLGEDKLLKMNYEVVVYKGDETGIGGLLCVDLEYKGMAGWIGLAFSEARRDPKFGRKEAVIGIPGMISTIAVSASPSYLGQQSKPIDSSPSFFNPGKYEIPAGGNNGYYGPSLDSLIAYDRQTLVNGSAYVVGSDNGSSGRTISTRVSFVKYLREPDEIDIEPLESTLLLYAVASFGKDGQYNGNPDWEYTDVKLLQESDFSKKKNSGSSLEGEGSIPTRKRLRQHKNDSRV